VGVAAGGDDVACAVIGVAKGTGRKTNGRCLGSCFC
jgi:hypothetical protein